MYSALCRGHLRVVAVPALAAAAGLLVAGCGGGGGNSKPAPPKPVKKTFTATADAYVRATDPGTNFGKNTELRVDGSPPVRTYIQFQPFSIPGRVERATLRVYPLSTSADGFQVRGISRSWSESKLTFDNAPSPGRVINLSGSLSRNNWHSTDVTKLLRSPDGTVGLVLVSLGPTEISLASRERAGRAPQLVIESRPPAKSSS
jgi:hypothetical protein